MVPDHCTPTCHKMFITVKENFKLSKKPESGKESKQSKLKESVAGKCFIMMFQQVIVLLIGRSDTVNVYCVPSKMTGQAGRL